jgi:hypothetical protein
MPNNVDLTINANASGAIAALERLDAKIKDVSNKFGSHFEAMSGYAAALAASLIATGTAVAMFADEVTDLAKANGLAIGEVLALGEALAQNGGKAESVGRMLQTMSNQIDAANGGNLALVTTFGRLGVSMKDLGTLSNTEIRDKLLDSLAQIQDPIERNAKAMDIFGKSIVGVDIAKLAADQKRTRDEMEQYAPALTAAGDAWDNLGRIAHESKIAFAQAFKPIFEALAKLNPGIDELTVKFKLMGVALAVLGSAAMIAGLMKLYEVIKLIGIAATKNPFIAIAGALISVGIGVATYTGLLGEAKKEEEAVNTKVDDQVKTKEKVVRTQTGLNDAIKKEKDQLSQIGESLQKNFKSALNKYDLELKSLSLSEDDKKLAEAKAKVDEDAQNALFNLKQKYDGMDAATKARNLGLYNTEKAAIESNAEAQKKAIEQRITDQQRLINLLKDYQAATTAYGESQIAILDAVAKAQGDNGSIRDKIELEGKLSALTKIRAMLMAETNKLSEEEKANAISAITTATSSTAMLNVEYGKLNENIASVIEQLARQGVVSEESAKKILNGSAEARAAIERGGKNLIDTNQKIYDQSRDFSTGWNKSFRDYVDNATNAAKMAENLFTKAFQGMEDAFINFVKTGKFEWKGFVSMMLEELLRSQVRQLMANLVTGFNSGGGAGGSGGLFGGKIIPGFLAEGGSVTANKPYIVGERGPELFLPNTGGTMIPNKDLGGSGTQSTFVTYNINAVDAPSFKAMIARDPSFIHAVAMRGASSIPGRR